ncbi:MAG: nitronate monooxygenase [Microthrixaceae bacterium]|nr:nitronate monooxygenase [Microthrixaceae bacterium]
MKTALTEILGIEAPVMLAGMGGVSYHRLTAAVSEAGGFGCLGASTMSDDQMVSEIAAVRELTEKPFGVDLLTAAPQDMPAKVSRPSSTVGRRCSWQAWVFPARSWTSAMSRACWW